MHLLPFLVLNSYQNWLTFAFDIVQQLHNCF